MAFLEWRKFNFFNLHSNVDGGKIAEALQDATVRLVTSGNAHVVVCDESGWVHLVSRAWSLTSFKAHELSVTLACQLPHEPCLLTIGDEEPGGTSALKVWDWSRLDQHGNPKCVRQSRAIPPNLPASLPTALAVHESKSLMAVGLESGAVLLYRGDVTRHRASKTGVLPDSGRTAVTGLAFKGTSQLFVASRSSVVVYWLGGGVERGSALDAGDGGAAAGCSVLADQHFMVARSDAIYCYTPDGRGPCYALEGVKRRLDWFRNYLSIVSCDKGSSHHQLTILDIHNRFIVFSKTFEEIEAVITEWGSFYLLLKNKELVYLEEKDLQSKLGMLFKRNLYDVAIRLASSQHYDADGLAQIYINYADHLYDKGDVKGAIEQYVKTIGRLETSYVIRKYLDSRHLDPLIHYLQELHKQGVATEEHTTLLLTCFVKVDQHDQQGKLKQFISTNDNIDFNVDVAIEVARQASPDDALLLATNNKRHDCALRILIEDKRDMARALAYIARLQFDDADLYMKRYGAALVRCVPEEAAELVQLLCTDYKPRHEPLVDEATLSGGRREPDRARPDDYLALFLYDSERLVSLLRAAVAADPDRSKLVYNTLIEHLVRLWSRSTEESAKCEYERLALEGLKSWETRYDSSQVLIVCQMLAFQPGTLHIYEQNKLWREQVRARMRGGDAAGALAVCRGRGAECPQLWVELLHLAPPPHALPEALDVICRERLMSPMQVVDSLAASSVYSLGDVRRYLAEVLRAESEAASRQTGEAARRRADTARMREQIAAARHEPAVLQSSRCTACGLPLQLSAVHFLCAHSYHTHCFQSIACEEESACPACLQQLGPAARAPPSPPLPLHQRLRTETDPYAVVSEYFGHGLFNKLTVVGAGGAGGAGGAVEMQPLPARAPPHASPAGPGAESRQRLQEGHSKDLLPTQTCSVSRTSGAVAVSEGRMRVLEASARYGTSLDARRDVVTPTERSVPSVHAKIPSKRMGMVEQISLPTSATSSPRAAPAPAPAPAPANTNPFAQDEEPYDESKNPFAEPAQDDDPRNPFANDDDDYDTNLNPFS